MFFTQNDYKKIEDWLQKRAIKDTEFPFITAINGSELFPIIQNGENRTIDFNSFWGETHRVFKTELKEFAKCIKAKADALIEERVEAENAIIEDLNNEIQNREQADGNLSNNITKEIKDRKSADDTLQNNIDNVDKKFANYPKLDSGIIPSQYLPSYVDDVLEYSSLLTFPVKGETGKIYVSLDTNLTYRWTGSDYIEISKSLGLGETSSTAYPGDKGNELATKLADIESGAQKNKNSLEYLQTAVGSNNTSVPLKDKTNLILKTSEDSGILLIPNTTYAQVEFSLTEEYKKNKANGIPSLDNTGKIPIEQLPESVVNNNAFTKVSADQGNFTATSTNTAFKIAGSTGIKTSLSNTNTIEVSLTEEYKKGANNGIAELVNGRIPANRMPEGFDNPGGSNLQIGTTTGTAFDGGKGAALTSTINDISEWKNRFSSAVVNNINVEQTEDAVTINASKDSLTETPQGSIEKKITAVNESKAGVMTPEMLKSLNDTKPYTLHLLSEETDDSSTNVSVIDTEYIDNINKGITLLYVTFGRPLLGEYGNSYQVLYPKINKNGTIKSGYVLVDNEGSLLLRELGIKDSLTSGNTYTLTLTTVSIASEEVDNLNKTISLAFERSDSSINSGKGGNIYTISEKDRTFIFNGYIPKKVSITGGAMTETGNYGILTTTVKNNTAYIVALSVLGNLVKFILTKSSTEVTSSEI